MIGTHRVTLGGEDISCLVDQVSIHHGRDDSDNQPDASSATVDLTLETPVVAWPAHAEIGQPLAVATSVDPGVWVTRFTGSVSDVNQGWEDYGPDTPNHAVVQIIAAGSLADLGRHVVGDVPWPQELDGARVQKIFAAAGIAWDAATSDPGTVQVLARDVDAQSALDLAQGVAADAGGLVWETRDNQVRYADADHRRNLNPTLALDACDVLVTPTWSRTTAGLTNDVSVGYGVAADGGDQPRFRDTRPQSIASFGTWAVSFATQLAALSDATGLAELLLTRNSTPAWIMSALPVDMKNLDHARTVALLGLELGSLLSLTGLPSAGTVPTSADLWVEGWTETLAWGTHEITLAVSGYCRTSPPPRWDDVPPSYTWDTMDPALTWDAISCIGPTPNLGRWNDVPASVRWDHVPPAITWDTWNTWKP